MAHLQFEFNKFNKNKRRLTKILNETKTSLLEIHNSEYFTKEQLDNIDFKSEDAQKIRNIIQNPIGIVILGSKSWAKAVILNELLGYALLPVNFDDSHFSNNWRTVRFMYGSQTQVSFAVPNCFELVEHLAIYDRAWHQIPRSDLELNKPHEEDQTDLYSATLEIKLPHQLLLDNVQIIIAPSTSSYSNFESIYNSCFEGIAPIVIYALSDADFLNSQEIDDLMEFKKLAPKLPIYFIRAQKTCSPILMDISPSFDLTESQQHLLKSSRQFSFHSAPSSFHNSSLMSQTPFTQRLRMLSASPSIKSPSMPKLSLNSNSNEINQIIYQQLISLGFLFNFRNFQSFAENDSHDHRFFRFINENSKKSKHTRIPTQIEVQSELMESFENFKTIVYFSRSMMQSYLVEAANLIHGVHLRCLRMFILTAFDMTRDMMITPKRIEYAKLKEQQLFDSLISIANKKQEEIKLLIVETINSMKDRLITDAGNYNFKFNSKLNHFNQYKAEPRILNSSGEEIFKSCSPDIASSELRINKPSVSSPKIQHLSRNSHVIHSSNSSTSSTSSFQLDKPFFTNREVQIATSEVQDFVLSSLNSAIADKLIGSVDCLRNSYIGTLERCLKSLENFPGSLNKSDSIYASNALKQILNAAYHVEINMRTTSSLLRNFWEKMKQLVVVPLVWRTQPSIDKEWKKRVSADVLDSLSESRLAKSICSQFNERLKASHEQFSIAMKNLESIHSGRLEKTEEQRVKVRKQYAPKIARFALEVTSLRDVIIHGMPQIGREIGRGQYGVVYACDHWAGCSPVALKSVVPPDDKHWNDLAMEFYYTRSIPEHDRIVQIRGSVIDHSYGGGSTPAVLLIMDRLGRDLHTAIKNGIDWLSRLQIAIDVVQGIRFLHSQGLVHRDIKLKNVLLDKKNRAKITDLGFCKPEAMMSGSIVGTPIHMAPELFTGKYDNSVDVYAFGILFWYICAGHVRLPYIFEQCQNKDQLWNCVRKGVRPERLPQFDDECWEIMEKCWAKKPQQRPLLGDIEPKLVKILEMYKASTKSLTSYNNKVHMKHKNTQHHTYHVPPPYHYQDSESQTEHNCYHDHIHTQTHTHNHNHNRNYNHNYNHNHNHNQKNQAESLFTKLTPKNNMECF